MAIQQRAIIFIPFIVRVFIGTYVRSYKSDIPFSRAIHFCFALVNKTAGQEALLLSSRVRNLFPDLGQN